jgi:hypothetical protein
MPATYIITSLCGDCYIEIANLIKLRYIYGRFTV